MEATLDTPAVAAETSAAPATSEPSSTPAVSQRPASFEQAFEQIAAKEAAPEPAKAPAATTPAGTEPIPSAEPKPGAPPEERWPAILENARTKTIEARDKQWTEKAGWVLQLPEERQQAAPALVRDFYANPAMFIANVYGAIKDHPQWGPQLRALLGGNGNGNGHGHTVPADDEMPVADVDIVDQEGRVVGKTYGEKAIALREALLAKQYEQRLEQRLAPYEQERKALKDREAEAEFQRQATAAVDQSAKRILEILDNRTDLVQHVNTLIDSGTHWLDAALQVSKQHIKPQLAQVATAAAADTMRRKAAGNTANGAGGVVTPKDQPKTVNELANLLEQLDRG